VAAERTRERDILEGTLGCPVCHAEYPIRDGVVWFDDGFQSEAEPAEDPELALRLAAFLDLSDAQGFAILAGRYAPLAELLRGVVPSHLIALNPSRTVPTGSGVSALVISTGIPLADATCRGIALDAAHAGAAHLDAAVRALRPRGRLVTPASAPLPDGVAELARDADLRVAERAAAPPKLVRLQGRGG
jgi:hypothetical protein